MITHHYLDSEKNGFPMKLHDLQRMVRDTAAAAFATDPSGTVVAWNRAAEELTGVASARALGRSCAELIAGADECGPFCRSGCSVRQALCGKRPVPAYELQIRTASGPQWCGLTMIPAELANGSAHALHLIHPADARKRLELAVRDFVKRPSRAASPAGFAPLTPRETEVLRLLARGCTSAAAATGLGISKATVNNHVQRISAKLHAHTRLEAVRRAESAGLI